MCEHSEQINELAAALAKAQGEIEGAEKARENTFFKQKYADLNSVWAACRGPLSKHGLSIVQSPSSDGPKVTMETLLLHSSGQWISGSISAMAKDATPQSIGSCVTYLRRYHLQSFAGVAAEDDDGESAQKRDEEPPATPSSGLGACPKCGKTGSVIAGKSEHGGGIVCWKKKEGCGHTWETPSHPFTPKHGEGNVPSDQSNGAKPPAPPAGPKKCKEYVALSNFVRNCGAETPEEATAIINWAVPDVGNMTDLYEMAGECKQIFDMLVACGMTGPQIYGEAVKGANAVV